MSGFSTDENSALKRKVSFSEPQVNVNSESDLITIFELDKCETWIKTNGFKNVCLQFPDPLLLHSTRVALYLEKILSVNAYVLGDTSYGSCCVDEVAAMHVDADCIIHFGMACLSPNNRFPVLYVFPFAELDVDHFVDSVLDTMKNNKCLIFYDCKYHRYYNAIQDKCKGFPNIILTTALKKEQETSEDVICNRSVTKWYKNAEFGVYLGPESMYLSNLMLTLPEKIWFRYENNAMIQCTSNTCRFLMKRMHLVEQIKVAHVLGIVVATLTVKNYLEAVNRVKDLAKKAQKKVYVFAVGKPNEAKLANFPEVDIFVLVACLENPLFIDQSDYYKPIASLFEVEIALAGRQLNSNFTFNFRELLPGGEMHDKNCYKADLLETDVSLITGKIAGISNYEDEENDRATKKDKEVALRDPGTITEHGGASFLCSRSWRGLQPNIGETEVKLAEDGRSGLPSGYENEQSIIEN